MSADRTRGVRAMFRRDQGVRMRSTVVATIIVALALMTGGALMLYMLHRHQDRTMYESTGSRSYEIARQIDEGGIGNIAPRLLAPTTGVDIIQVVNPESDGYFPPDIDSCRGPWRPTGRCEEWR